MARKPVQVQRFTNADQQAIGQKARFIGADGLEYETSPIAHFDVHPDGRISITTQSGSTYGNFDFEAQRIKDNAEWEAKFNNDQQAHYEKSLQVAMMKAQGAAQQELVNQFIEDARFGYDFPSEDIVRIIEDGETKYWNVCKSFETDDADIMKSFQELFTDHPTEKGGAEE